MKIIIKDHHIASFENGIIRVRNPRGLVAEFTTTGEVCGVERYESHWEQDTTKAVKDMAVKELEWQRNKFNVLHKAKDAA